MPKTGLLIAAAALSLWGMAGVHGADATPQAAPAPAFVIRSWPDDLPQSSVIAMTQTRDGYLWLGTLKGLVRFDGVSFKVFDENNTPGLSSSRIVYLFEDSRRNLWVGTEAAGILLIESGRVVNTGIGAGTPAGRLTAACEDATGAVWLYTADGTLGRYANGQLKTGPFGAQYLSVYRGLTAEKSGPVWIGVDWGVYGMSSITNADPSDPPVDQIIPPPVLGSTLDYVLASREGGYWRLANNRVEKWRLNQREQDLGVYPWKDLANVRVTTACEDQAGNLIVGTLNGGVFWFTAEGKVTQISTNQGLSHNGVLSLCMDREGSLWVGTDGGGLNRVRPNPFRVAEASQGQVVQSAVRDRVGGLWMAIPWSGATYWSGNRVREHALTNTWTVFVDKDEQVWAGTRRGGAWLGGLFHLQGERFELVRGFAAFDRDVFAIHQDRRGRMWVGTQGGLVVREGDGWKLFTTRDGLLSDRVQAIADDDEGNLWIGTAGGLSLLQNGRFASYRRGENGLPNDNVSAVHVDRDNVVWVGTGGGLARFKSGQWTRYTKDQGLVSDSIAYVIEDERGDLWLGSNAGVMRVSKQSLNDFAQGSNGSVACRTYTRADGLPTQECTQGSQPAACATDDGRLWFPTIKGLVSVKPAALQRNLLPPPVLIESVQIEGQEQNTQSLLSGWLEAIRIPPGREQLEIHYTSLNLAAADRARFKYQMEGHDRTWIPAGDSRVARYSKLPPGDYRFRVIACNEDGVWNEQGASLAVTVEPAFWQTWWFRAAVAAGLLGLIVGAVYYVSTQKLQQQLAVLRQKEALEKERSRIARDLHDQLGANLTQVALLGEMAEADKQLPEEVEAHARQICQTARETTRSLDEIVWAANPANDTLDSLITYACKYAQDYLALAGLRHRLEVPPHLPDADLPPEVRHNVFLAFKEAVNNVVKHAKASEARIRLLLNESTFTLEVEDDGRGLAGLDEKAAATRNGLRNMRKRMEDIHGRFSISARAGGGTVVRLTGPLRRTAP